jgi:hypothetical protein
LALSVFGQVRFPKISVLVCLWFCSVKSVFIAGVLVGLSFLVIWRFIKFCFQSLPKTKLCVKVGRVGGGSGFQLASLAQSQLTKRGVS